MLDAVAESSDGVLAQLGEHLPYKQRVTGSSPVGPIYMDLYTEHGGIAQLARAHGSYPWCRGFESPFRYFFVPKIRERQFIIIKDAHCCAGVVKAQNLRILALVHRQKVIYNSIIIV